MDFDLKPLGQAGEWLGGAAIVKPFLEKILGPSAMELGGLISDPIANWRKELKDRRDNRAIQIATRAAEQSNRSGEEPIQIPDYIAVPLLDKATLVDDENLQEMWASLLANATNPTMAGNVSHIFPTILAGLSPREAQFLNVIFDYSVNTIQVKIRPFAPSTISYQSRMNDEQLINTVGNSNFRWLGDEEKKATIQNMISLGVFGRDEFLHPNSFSAIGGKIFAAAKLKTPHYLPADDFVHMQSVYFLTITGVKFMMACRPFDRQS
jgi:Abortive infection alpha